MRPRTILLALLIVGLSFAGATLGMQVLWPSPAADRRPALAEVPPLPQTTATSVIVAPVTVSLTALRDAMDMAAPRDVTGRRDNPISQVLSHAEIGWIVARGPLALAGRPETLLVSTPLNGTLRATGQLSARAAGNLGGIVGGLLGDDIGRGVQSLAGKTFDQRADIRGNVTLTARPALTPAWRIEPNLAAQVAVADAALSAGGLRLSVSNEVKPLIERSVNEQVNALQARLRNDPAIEQAARREWTKLCRSIALGTAGAGIPGLWLEVRPKRAFAAQPRIDAVAITFTIGVEAETRVVPTETKPDCPFPANLELVSQAEEGRVNIAVPIDVPFTEVSRLIEARLAGKTFPQEKGGPFQATIRSARLAPSGDRLLLSLQVKANEKTSWFGLGSEATVHVWGRPVLDPERQLLRIGDIALDVESEAAFGLLGAAARAAIPFLQAALAENAVIDLNPFAANARKSIETAIADFRVSADGVRVDADVTDLRLTGIAFDANTLRIIAAADGTAKVAVTALTAH